MTRFFSYAMVGFLAVLLVSALAVPGAARAGSDEDSRIPLIAIRFNQDRVYYDQQLHDALSKAASAKPGVMFEVISRAPAGGNAESDRRWQGIAGRNTKSVIATMQQMGVPPQRISVMGKSAPGALFDETLIYVY